MARQVLKKIIEKGLEEEMAEFLGLQPNERDSVIDPTTETAGICAIC